MGWILMFLGAGGGGFQRLLELFYNHHSCRNVDGMLIFNHPEIPYCHCTAR